MVFAPPCHWVVFLRDFCRLKSLMVCLSYHSGLSKCGSGGLCSVRDKLYESRDKVPWCWVSLYKSGATFGRR